MQVLQFVLDAVRAEAFNPATLFLFGSYTIGKERLFLEVARILKRKVWPQYIQHFTHRSRHVMWICQGMPWQNQAGKTCYKQLALMMS